MTTDLPAILYTAIGVFQGGPDWRIEVAVPNFLKWEDAQAYASAFRIKMVDGKLYRDDGKGAGVFDDSWRDVLDTDISVSRIKAPGSESDPVSLPVAQWASEPGLNGEFTPVAWHVAEDKL
jgi:hypothetical protein